MCLIVDANQFSSVFGPTAGSVGKPIIEWLSSSGALVFGGSRYQTEVSRHNAAARMIKVLYQAGRAFLIPGTLVDAREATLRGYRSNDPHVLALAIESGARVLCTQDQALIDDFKDQSLVGQPRGRIYKKASHRRLLAHSADCPYPKRIVRRPHRRK